MAEVWVVTGGIGSGKSLIRGTLERLGAVTIDADRIGHEVLEPEGPAFSAVARRWPEAVSDGRVDRAALGRIVFDDREALAELEAITHPAIAAEIATRIADAGDRVVVVEVSVPTDIIGVGPDRTIVADLPLEIRKERLRGKGMEPDDIERRMANQPDREGWRRLGRWTISTEGSKAEVAERVAALWRHTVQKGG